MVVRTLVEYLVSVEYMALVEVLTLLEFLTLVELTAGKVRRDRWTWSAAV